MLIGIPKEDKSWDKIHFARCMNRVKILAEVFDGDLDKVEMCIRAVYDDFHVRSGLNVTLETVVKHAHTYKLKQAQNPKELEKKKKEGWAEKGLSPCHGADIEVMVDGKKHCSHCMVTLDSVKLEAI